MPAEWGWKGTKSFWESSQRPCYVRTVWVDGFRHAVLTRDDPALVRARPCSSNVYNPTRKAGALVRAKTATWKHQSDRADELLNECFVSITLEPHRESAKIDASMGANDYLDSSDDASEVIKRATADISLTAHAPPLYKHDKPKHAKRESFLYREVANAIKCERDEEERDDERFCDRVLEWVDNNDHVVRAEPEQQETYARPTVSHSRKVHRKLNMEEFAAIYRWDEPNEPDRRVDAMPANVESEQITDQPEEELSYRQPIYFENAPRTQLHIFVPSLLKNT